MFACLGPLELAACACVCCEWRAALASPAGLPLWSRHLKWTFPRPEPPRLGCTLAPGYENLSALADDRDRFYALAAGALAARPPVPLRRQACTAGADAAAAAVQRCPGG